MHDLGHMDPHPHAAELLDAIYELRERGLHTAVTWATEQLVGLWMPVQAPDQLPAPSGALQHAETNPRYHLARSYFDLKVGRARLPADGACSDLDFDRMPAAADPPGQARCQTGRPPTLADLPLQEYRRAAHALQDVPGVKALFLRCYSLYLAGERARE
jgi:anaphase-promoting complex subunit 8